LWLSRPTRGVRHIGHPGAEMILQGLIAVSGSVLCCQQRWAVHVSDDDPKRLFLSFRYVQSYWNADLLLLVDRQSYAKRDPLVWAVRHESTPRYPRYLLSTHKAKHPESLHSCQHRSTCIPGNRSPSGLAAVISTVGNHDVRRFVVVGSLGSWLPPLTLSRS